MRMPRALGLGILAALTGACASIFGDTAWADGEVRDLATRQPIAGARVLIEGPGEATEPAASDRTNGAGKFSVLHASAGEGPTTRLLVVAEGYKPAEYLLPTRQSNLLIAYMAPAASGLVSRVEQMPAPAEGGNGQADSSSGN